MTLENHHARTQRAANRARSTVLVVDDHPVVRVGVRHLMTSLCEMDVCGEAATADEALKAYKAMRPDLVLVDLNLAGNGTGLDLIRALRGLDAKVPILVWTMQSTAGFATRALRVGASGFLDKSQAPTEMATAIATVMNGGMYIPAELRDDVFRGLAGGPRSSAEPEDALTDRELEIFSLIGGAKGAREIADVLGVSVKTVETHCANIKQKLRLGSGTELAQRATLWVTRSA